MKQNFFRFIASKIKILSVLVLISFVAAGCNSGNNGSTTTDGYVTLKFWKPFTDSEEMQNFIGEYQAAHPRVRIEYTKKNIENYEEDLIDALASGNGPDIFSINNAWLPKYQDKITPAPQKVFSFNDYKNTFLDVITEDFTKDNQVYGTALSVDTLALYYNKDLLGSAGFASPPKTWEELGRQVRNITKQNDRGYFTVSGVAMGTSGNVNRSQDILYLLMLQSGVQAWSTDKTRPTFAQPVTKNGKQIFPGALGLSYYTSFANPNSANYTWNTQSDYSIDAFANGRAAFLYGYSFTRDTIIDKAPNLNFDVAPVPQVNLDDPRVNFSNYFGEVVSKQSKNSEIAWDFLKFITTKEKLSKYYTVYKYPSSRKDLVETQTQDPKLSVFAYSGLTAKQFYRPDQARVDTIMLKAIDNVVLTGMRVDQAISQAEQQVSTIGRSVY